MAPRGRVLAAAAAAAVVVVGVAFGGFVRGPQVVARTGGATLERLASGLMTSHPFTTDTPLRVLADEFEFNGDAGPAIGFVSSTAAGLDVGVRANTAPTFQGWFAVPYAAYPRSAVFHVRMRRPAVEATGPALSVFAVQTASTKMTGLINYVVVASHSAQDGNVWEAGYAHGKVANAQTDIYWSTADDAPEQEITVQTDGRNRLTVWFGDRPVFSSDQLDMDIEAPFQPYLEVQALRTASVANFTDYWITSSDSVGVEGVPPSAQVCLTPSGGAVPICSTAAGGAATLRLPPPHCNGEGVLSVRPSERLPVQFTGVGYSCGSRYRVRGV